MKKLKTGVSGLIMVIAGIIGLYLFNGESNGAILFSMIAGIACIIYTIDNQEK